MAAQQLEQILALLLQPDNAVIQQATAQLKEVLKQPAALSHLCHIMTHSQDPQLERQAEERFLEADNRIQQFAAVLLRRRLSKHWKNICTADQDMLKSLVLNSFQQQTDHKVSLGLAQLAAVILKNETLEKWPQILHSIQHGARSQDPHKCQMALLLLQSALDLEPDQFYSYYKDLLHLFHHTLSSRNQPAILYYSLRSLSILIGWLSSDEVPLMSSMMPKVIAAIRELIQVNEVHASEAMEIFDELLETEVAILVQHLSEVVHFCLEVASNQQLSDGLRMKALSCISYLIKLKGKAILKHKLLLPILNTLFPIMSAEPPPGQMDVDDELIEDEVEVQTPKHFAVQVIDMLALYLPPEKLFPQLTPLMEPALVSPNPYSRKTGLMCIAMLAEGCRDHIRNKHLQPMLQIVCRALADDSLLVRNAALFALGQFSENLQPDITHFSDEIMPLLLRYMEEVQVTHPTQLAKAYYALENFVENLEDKIEPYLPILMERMLNTLTSPGTPRIKELAVSTIGAIAQAAKESLLPYFQAIMEHLTVYMLTTREDLRPIQIQSVGTMAILANVLGNNIFQPFSEKCCQLGLDLCDRVDDPDLRRCTYSLFGSLANIMGDSITPYLPRIMTLLIYSLKSTDDIKLTDSSENSFLLFDDEEEEVEAEEESLTDEEEDSEDSEDSESVGMCVQTAFMDEKEDACIALGEIAISVSMPFLPYIETSFQQVSQLLLCPQIRVRKAAFEAMGQLIISLHRMCKQDPSEAHVADFQNLVSTLLPFYLKGVQEDHEREVVIAILEVLAKVLKECKRNILREPAQLTDLCRLVRKVLQHKVACQDNEEDEEDDNDEAEYDGMLIENAGELIPVLAEACGGDIFAPYFASLLPLFLKKMKPSCSTADKSFAVGVVAETVQALEGASSSFIPHLLPVLMRVAHDEDQEVSSNAVFGLGVLAEQCREAMFEHYPQILALLSNLISQKQNNRVTDNVCGAVARMLMTNPGGIPIEQVFPVVLRALPLQEDLEEYETIYRCITFIYENDPLQVLQQIPEIVRSSGSVLGCKNLPTEARNLLITLLGTLSARCPTEFQAAVLANPPEVGTLIYMAIGSAP